MEELKKIFEELLKNAIDGNSSNEEENKAELVDALNGLYMQLDDIIVAIHRAKVIANNMGGEIKRVIGGQLSYTMKILEKFKESESQPGSITHLLNFLKNQGGK